VPLDERTKNCLEDRLRTVKEVFKSEAHDLFDKIGKNLFHKILKRIFATKAESLIQFVQLVNDKIKNKLMDPLEADQFLHAIISPDQDLRQAVIDAIYSSEIAELLEKIDVDQLPGEEREILSVLTQLNKVHFDQLQLEETSIRYAVDGVVSFLDLHKRKLIAKIDAEIDFQVDRKVQESFDVVGLDRIDPVEFLENKNIEQAIKELIKHYLQVQLSEAKTALNDSWLAFEDVFGRNGLYHLGNELKVMKMISDLRIDIEQILEANVTDSWGIGALSDEFSFMVIRSLVGEVFKEEFKEQTERFSRPRWISSIEEIINDGKNGLSYKINIADSLENTDFFITVFFATDCPNDSTERANHLAVLKAMRISNQSDTKPDFSVGTKVNYASDDGLKLIKPAPISAVTDKLSEVFLAI
jgi:hypothetical protein